MWDRGLFYMLHSMSSAHTAEWSETGWEHFPHAADIGVRGWGPIVSAAFEQAALALVAVVSDLNSIRPETIVEIRCEAPNFELLFVDWLNSIVFEMATRNMLFSEFHVTFEGDTPRLTGWARGESIDPARHAPAAEVKGATFSELEVARSADGRWQAQCIVDV